jgi:hypothetical protein
MRYECECKGTSKYGWVTKLSTTYAGNLLLTHTIWPQALDRDADPVKTCPKLLAVDRRCHTGWDYSTRWRQSIRCKRLEAFKRVSIIQYSLNTRSSLYPVELGRDCGVITFQ